MTRCSFKSIGVTLTYMFGVIFPVYSDCLSKLITYNNLRLVKRINMEYGILAYHDMGQL